MTKKKKKRYIWLWIIAVILVIAGVAISYAWYYASAPYDGEAKRVFITSTASEKEMADSLASQLGEAYATKVMSLWRLQKGRLSAAAGSYVVEPQETALHFSRRLMHGLQTPVRVTFNNLRTFDQLTEKISSCLELSTADFDSACDSILIAEGFSTATFPAAFIPDTYEFYWNAKAPVVVKRLLGYRNNFWNDERLQKAKALGLSPEQVATVASIVEEETAKADERPKVARLYLNRLDKGMLLQADPTVKFAVGDFTLRRILNTHLQTESPYNTYKYPGLPPGPIRIASKDALDAVLSAPAHNYIYMCAKEDFSGYHNFASDYTTHQANAQRYHAELNRRKIK